MAILVRRRKDRPKDRRCTQKAIRDPGWGILGSFAYNLLVTHGLAAVIRPVAVEAQLLQIAVPVLIVVHLVLLALIWYGKMNRSLGGLFVALYLAYLIGIVWLH